MKSDVALDYAVFQLTPSRNRCELVVVCGEETERLASGLLKPFIVHLKAAEDQYATGTKEIKLQPPPGYGYGSKPESSAWFTKGTIERFVRFVSTPEVLERVGTVEAELVQLDGAIREHAIESTKVDVSQPSVAAATPSAASSILLTATTDQAPTPTPSRRNSLDGAENPAPDDNARRRLLRAMEARKMLLHKEQGMAFARATAAGFDVQKMEHLLVLADCFGANRLGDACVMYTSIFKKSKESGLWDENEWPLSDTTSLRNVPTSPELRPRESDLWSNMHSETGDYRLDELKDDVSVRSYSKNYSEDLSLRGFSSTDVLQKRNPLASSPSRGRDFNGDYSRSRGGSNQTSFDEGSRVSQGQEMFGNSYTDDSQSGNTHSMFTDNVNESGHEPGRAQRQRRAWGPPPQFLAHQIPVGVGLKSKSGPLLSGSDGYPVAVQVSNTAGITSSHRVVESLPSWVGQADQPWRPGSTEPGSHGLPRLLVPKAQAHGVSGNEHLQSTEPVVKPPETNGNVLPSPAVSWLEHKRRQGIGMQEKTGIPAPGSINVNNSASARGDEEGRPVGGKGGDRPQNKPVVRRASSPRRRSSSPMRRVQVGRNSMRRSGVMILKSVNYASTKPASNAQNAAKESEPSDEDTDDGSGGNNGVFPQQGVEKLGRSWRDQLRVDTDSDSLANLAQEGMPDQSPSRASSGWNTPADYETDYPENGNDPAPRGQASNLLSPKERKGRFYEQYREKRDAKLRDESESKKAEREAKLKSMQEVLEHRKAEMPARKGRGMVKHSSDGEVQVLAEKLRNSKIDSQKIRRHKDDDEGKRQEEIANQRRERIAARSSPSPPSGGAASAVSTTSTPKTLEKQQQQQQQQASSIPSGFPTMIPTPSLTPKGKPHAARRLSSPQKVSAGAFRGTVSSPAAPASAPKLVRPSQRKLQSAPPNREVENPLSRSVPSLAELRKENTKPSSVRNSAVRSTGTKIPGIRGTSAPPESNGSKIVSKAAPAEEKKRRAATRKSVAGAMETVPDVLKVLKAPTAEAKSNKRLSLTSATNGDSKPFLRKGRGIGPGSGPNVRKSKVAAAPEPAKPFEEDVEKSISDSEHEPVKADVIAELEARDSISSVEECKEVTVRPDLTQASEASNVEVTSDLVTRPSTPPHGLPSVLNDEDEMIRPNEWQEPELAEDTGRGEDFPSTNADQYATPAELVSENSHSSTLRHFLDETSENVSVVNTGTVTPTQRSSPIHSIPLRSLSPKVSEALDQYNVPRADAPNLHHDVPVADNFSVRGVSNSPATSPAPPQLQLSHSPEGHTSSRLRKKWLSSQKPVAPPPVKEAPRGLKRLLKFGLKKKDKSSTASTTSDSPSDIDDDVDITIEHVGRSDELTHIGAKSLGSRIPGKGSSLMGHPAIPEDSATGDSGVRLISIPFVRSSIPTAPAHFKTRDEHVGGSSLLKAPRSFFSLSSFRSKSKQ